MSTGPRKQAAFIQGNQSTIEHDASHSALFYLFQEVSKLASPVHNSFLDPNLPSAWLHETSRHAPLIVEKKEEDGHLFKISNGSCQYSLSPYKQMKKVKEENHCSKVTTVVEPHPKGNSPWKVLSLINLQCERLLHQGDVESEPSLLSSTTKLGHSIDKSSTATADVMDQRVGGASVECSLRPSLICESQVIPSCVRLADGVRGNCRARSYKPQCRVKDSKVGCCVQSQAAENVSLLTVDRQCECNQECRRVYSEQDILHAPFSEKFSSEPHIPYAFLDAQLTFNSNEDANVALSKPALDPNSNLNLTAEPPCDAQLHPPNPVLPPRSASLLFGTPEKCQSLAKRDDKIASSEPECTNPSPSATSKKEQRPLQNEDISSPSPQQWITKTPRKQPHPRRSADIQDPDFQGVSFRMYRELDDNREQCRLLITSNYSKEFRRSVRKPKQKKRTCQKSSKSSSSDEESYLTASSSKVKVCASCCTRKTPMWRDAEDGTPLCNACGIRYKKYRVRCVKCWHIPRKEGNSNSCCLKCGNFVRLTSAQRKHNA
ncbi:GATA-type zinc finger protein 1 isoform X1 [Pseudoliparis swirei]|uniref:GATA-type zinc finger protein 1 isoform X1 n=1 Tax=Pseudoliparis swirei TaxID=2059687 RepID=UPI0024BE1606|nr:GATA-type zinc finger protein 1 isoform X1 [Pseudoliparis swirei]